jgi:hypothetical protein
VEGPQNRRHSQDSLSVLYVQEGMPLSLLGCITISDIIHVQCDHNRRLRGIIPKAKTPFDLSRRVEDWDRQNYEAVAIHSPRRVGEVQQSLAHASSTDERSSTPPDTCSPSAGYDDEQLNEEFSLDVNDLDDDCVQQSEPSGFAFVQSSADR